MNRVEFMKQLERLLGDIPEYDRLDAIAYYNDYFDEAGTENEAQVIRELGSPGKVAAIIKADLNTNRDENTTYTEHDGEAANMPTRRESGYHAPKQKKGLPWPLIIVLLVFASPLLIGTFGGLFGALLGVFGALIGIVIAFVACALALLVAGIVCFVVGIVRVFISPVEGLITVGLGSLMLALGILFAVLFVWCAFKWIPALFRGTVNWIQRLFQRGERRKGV
jgi:uncharacterized membrane protein